MDWELSKKLKETLAAEQGYYKFPAGTRTRVALVYPNTYFVGMSNLGLHVIYELLNTRGDIACERAFLPERKEWIRYQNTRTPILTVENQSPLADFAMLAFVVSFEMDYFHILSMLMASHVEVHAEQRGERDPLIIAGGPCATFNPEPLAPFFDAFVIGEGEAVLPRLMDTWQQARREGCSRAEILERLAVLPGVYVPSCYTVSYHADGRVEAIAPKSGSPAPASISRQWVHDLDAYPAHTVVVTDNTEFNFYLIETARGCGRHCRFCMAGYCFRRPRNRSLSVVEQEVDAAKPFGKKIGLMGAAISDYPEVDALTGYIQQAGLPMSVASFRADSVTKPLVASLAASGLKTLTLAPEAGSARLRAVINKGIEEEDLFRAMHLGIAAGIRNFRLYLMVGLPFETDEDIEAMVDLANRLKDEMEANGAHGLLTLSVNPFIPKPFTPFQWLPMCDKKTVEKRLKYLEKTLRKRRGIEVNIESPKEAYVQEVLSRGDRRVGEALYLACERGGSKAFKRALKMCKLDPSFYLYRERGEDEVFPWEMLDMGVRKSYLYHEIAKAEAGEATRQCFEGCLRCGVCSLDDYAGSRP